MPLGRGLFWIVQMTLVRSVMAISVLAKAPLRIPSRQFTRLRYSRNTVYSHLFRVWTKDLTLSDSQSHRRRSFSAARLQSVPQKGYTGRTCTVGDARNAMQGHEANSDSLSWISLWASEGCLLSMMMYDAYWKSVSTGPCARVYQSGGDVSVSHDRPL